MAVGGRERKREERREGGKEGKQRERRNAGGKGRKNANNSIKKISMQC